MSMSPSRRAIIKGGVWSLPVVAVAAAAPLASASPEPVTHVVVPLSGFSAAQCDTVARGSVSFSALDDSNAAAVDSPVTITLPPGLQFLDGTTQVTLRTDASGVVQVPEFRVLGASGTYAITAEYHEGVGYASGTVTTQPGRLVQLTRAPGGSQVSPTITAQNVGITNGLVGSISGDQAAGSAGANAAVITSTGLVRYWGRNVGADGTAPGTLQYAGTNVTGVQFVDSWTGVQNGTDTTGGVAAGADGNAVYQWFRNGTGSGTPNVVKVSNISGTVLAAESNDGYSYVLTDNGLYYWANAETGTAVAATLIAGTAGATKISTWSTRGPNDSTLAFGGAVQLANGSVATWTGNHTLTAAGAPSGIARLVSTPFANYILTTSGTLYTSGTAFSAAPGGAAWTARATNVSTFSAWGYQRYTGGLYILGDGTVEQFFAAGAEGRTWSIEQKDGFASGVSITQAFASDGTYLALASDGTVYAWAGNLDNPGRTQPALVTSISNASDLEVWGYHVPGGTFFGGGYIIARALGCA